VRRTSKIIRAALAAAFAGAALTAAAPTAIAAPSETPPPAAAQWGCSDHEFCLFENNDGLGWVLHMTDDEAIPDLISNLNDRGSSVRNRTDSEMCLYEHTNYRGRVLESVPPGSKYNLPQADQDKVSSVKKC
jgi:Peptidase inhibitor family I36